MQASSPRQGLRPECWWPKLCEGKELQEGVRKLALYEVWEGKDHVEWS